MDSNVSSARAALLSELREVEQHLAEYEKLRERRKRLIDAISAVDAVEGMQRGVMSGMEEVRHSVRRLLAGQVLLSEPDGPSDAALAILREAERPLHIRDIVGVIQGKGWFLERNYESLRATIAGTLDARAARDDGGIVKPEPATYMWVGPTFGGGDSRSVVGLDVDIVGI